MKLIKDLILALKSLTSQAHVLMNCYMSTGRSKVCPSEFDIPNLNDIGDLTAHVLMSKCFEVTIDKNKVNI